MSALSLKNLLADASSGGLETLIEKARKMDALGDALRAELPEKWGSELIAANVRSSGMLVLVASSPAWASNFRFEEKSLLEAARKAGFEANSMKVTVCRQ